MSNLALIPSSGFPVSDSVVFNPSSLIRVLVLVPVLDNIILPVTRGTPRLRSPWHSVTCLCSVRTCLAAVAGFPFIMGFPASCSVTFRLQGVATSSLRRHSWAPSSMQRGSREPCGPVEPHPSRCGLRGDGRLWPRAHLLPSAELTPVRLPGALRSKSFAALATGSRAEPRCLSSVSFRMLPPGHGCHPLTHVLTEAQ